MAYAGKIYSGVDYSPTWVGWSQTANAQTNDSDFANDAFASLWNSAYQSAPAGDPSVPGIPPGTANPTYRNDLQTIASDGFNLVRLYNWDMARGTSSPGTSSPSDTGLDHLNFLNAAKSNGVGVKVVVPVSDFFISNGQSGDGWNGTGPDSNYSFGSATQAIQTDFKQFIKSITDPATNKISTAIHSIDVGNEGDLGQGISDGTTAAQFLARTNWWIYNLHQQINGTAATGPDGDAVVNGSTGTIIPITATFSNGNQMAWFTDLINGVSATTNVPTGGYFSGTFGTAVTGLSSIDPGYASYYYNSVNVSQSQATAPYTSFISTQVLAPYDAAGFSVPLMLMEVFTNNRSMYPTPTDQATAAVNQAQDIENYLKTHNAGTGTSTTNVMGYNYFEFTDEPSSAQNKFTGLYELPTADGTSNNHTGTTSTFYGGFGDSTYPADTLTATPGPTGVGGTLFTAWTGAFGATVSGTAGTDKLVGTDWVDIIQGGAGNDTIDGGAGYDIALYGRNAQAYTLKATAGSAAITIQDKVGTDGTDTLTNIDQVRFANGPLPTSWMLTTASMPAAQVLKVVDLYTAGLGRAPDALGLDYWASQLAAGASLKDISKAIFSSPEAAAIYSPANADPVFINFAYQTAFGHAPDAAGATYWANELSTGHIQRTDFVTALLAGASAADKQYVANHEAVGAHFALTDGLSNITSAKAVEASVNGTAASVAAANAQSDAFAATAATAAGSELVVQIVGLVP